MPDTHQEAVGARIAQLREQQGWSQRALAKWVGLDQSAVSRIEAGRRRLSADELQRFAHAFHITTDEMLRTAALPASFRAARLLSDAPADAFALELAMDASTDEAVREVSSPPPARSSASEMRMDSSEPPARLARMASSPGPAPLASMAGDDVTLGEFIDEATRSASMHRGRAPGPGLPDAVFAVARDWFALRGLAEAPEPAQRWSTGHSAEGKPERLAHTAATPRPGAPARDVLYDRVARFWRSELHVEPDDGPLPDLVPLLEDGYGAQVIVARVGRKLTAPDRAGASSERPVAASFSVGGVPFVFVNAARPVVLQRFALAHAFAHHVLGHGDVVDHRIEWSRNVPPEAAANDFTEEFLAPVRAVQRWYERRDVPRWVRLEDLLDLANAFGISAWSALFRSRAAGRLHGKQFHVLRGEMRRLEWELLPRQAYLGGVRDTLSVLTPAEALPSGEYGGPAVLRVPAPMRAWTLSALQGGRLSLEDAAAFLRIDVPVLADQLDRLGLE